MALHEASRFGRADFQAPADLIATALEAHRDELSRHGWVHCGYAEGMRGSGVPAPRVDVSVPVDGGFRLEPVLGFESVPAIVTTGLRSSRFAPVLFWEVLHALAPGGVWIDVDQARWCEGTALHDEDFLQRDYFRTCLLQESDETGSGVRQRAFRKTSPSPIAANTGDGWTFGILTAGPSPRAAQMARDLLALDLPKVEVVICGPRPAGVPEDPRIRVIDLERPEPRGWITRKKNLLAEAATHENLCLLHDRYVITPDFARALLSCGRTASFVTFPQVYFADTTRRFPQRYPDYQVLYQREGIQAAHLSNIYDSNHILHPSYDDFSETAFCCGGLYVTRRTLWNLVRQDEALYHCEWEDISFGLDCQRKGMPHRVNPSLTVESIAPHPLLLTRIHDLRVPDAPVRGRLHVTPAQTDAACLSPGTFKPVMAVSRTEYLRADDA